jgi:hypothetical protein
MPARGVGDSGRELDAGAIEAYRKLPVPERIE